ncbi:EpsG family protein [Shewanella kaireitica]|uniref:EpsG family protein n=1 Tax=Shewanella kaireitica TaxID=212021 RepID=UPI002010AB6E|nr:EpsG family protein [Shewanella kaireitica]MCL1095728.1 EpsG family protein [Shewanella kaireitica]
MKNNVMILASLSLLSLFSFFSFFEKGLAKSPFYIFLFVTLVLFATFRDGSSLPDYDTYTHLFHNVVHGQSDYFIEISFTLLARLANLISSDNFYVLFFLYAFVAILVKFKAIVFFSPFPFYSFVVYLSNYFIIHELIQIRAGVAVALVFISFYFIFHRSFYKYFFVIAAATFFHYSSFIFLLLYFIDPYRIKRSYIVLLIPFSYFFMLLFSSSLFYDILLSIIPFEGLVSKLVTYSANGDSSINVFGFFIISRIIVLCFFSYHYQMLSRKHIYFPFFLLLYSIGIFFYISLSSFPHMGVRLGYSLMYSEVFLIPYLICIFKGYFVSRFIVVLYSLLAFLTNVLFTSYFHWS